MIEEKYYKRVFAKKVPYAGYIFNSKMECDFARYLDGDVLCYQGVYYYHKTIKWESEPEAFELIPQEQWIDKTEQDKSVKTIKRNKKHTLQRVIYTPDFYLPEYNLLVEVKGKQFDDELFRLRFRLFKHFYPDKAIWLLTSHEDFEKIDEILENLKL